MSFKLILFYKTILVLHHHFEMAGIHFYFRNSSAQNNLDFEFTYPICTRLNRTHFFVIKCVFGALKSSNLLFRIAMSHLDGTIDCNNGISNVNGMQ